MTDITPNLDQATIAWILLAQILGGARRDRTADLFAASEALSQLSYSPEILYSSNNWPNSYQICLQPVDLTLAENEAHSKQQLRNCQHLFFLNGPNAADAFFL